MRIRVRAWHKTQKKMYCPEELAKDQLTLMPDGSGFINVHGRSTSLSRVYDHMVPLLFTGLQDKNGKEIYEGDVVRIPAGWTGDYWQYEEPHVVEWGSDDHDHNAGFYLSAPDGIHWSNCEVIGNVYEHPALMGADTDDQKQ